jgi:type VI secretion system protein ImpH
MSAGQAGPGALFHALRALPAGAVRVRGSVSLAFPAGDIEAMAAREGVVVPAVLGLLGGAGALPYHYTERIAASAGRGGRIDGTRAFLDIFAERTLLLHYAAWRKHRLDNGGTGADPRRAVLAALAGLVDSTSAPPGVLAHAAALGRRTVPAGMLAGVLAAQLAVPVAVEQFVGTWDTLRPEHRNALGSGNCALSGGVVLGQRMWRRDLCARIHMGPLARQAFERFLPGGPGALALAALLRSFAAEGVGWEVRLHLRAGEAQAARLQAGGPRLGFDAFMMPGEGTRDDVTYVIQAA